MLVACCCCVLCIFPSGARLDRGCSLPYVVDCHWHSPDQGCANTKCQTNVSSRECTSSNLVFFQWQTAACSSGHACRSLLRGQELVRSVRAPTVREGWCPEAFLVLDAGVVAHLIQVVDSEWVGASADNASVWKISQALMSAVFCMSAQPMSPLVFRQKMPVCLGLLVSFAKHTHSTCA